MKMIEIYHNKIKVNKDTYEFTIEEKVIEGWGVTHSKGRARPKMYSIKKNNEMLLSTSLHQVYYARKKKILS